MRPTNLLFILSDEHNKRVTGCDGHPMIRTPNLDGLARRGTRFTSAYTNCPICAPARASFATGRYVHQVRCWDNAIAYQGQPASWGHRLMAQGHRVVSIGKLHYKASTPEVNGFDEEILPMHIVNGVGDLLGLIRDELPRRPGSLRLGPEAGRGEPGPRRPAVPHRPPRRQGRDPEERHVPLLPPTGGHRHVLLTEVPSPWSGRVGERSEPGWGRAATVALRGDRRTEDGLFADAGDDAVSTPGDHPRSDRQPALGLDHGRVREHPAGLV